MLYTMLFYWGTEQFYKIPPPDIVIKAQVFILSVNRLSLYSPSKMYGLLRDGVWYFIFYLKVSKVLLKNAELKGPGQKNDDKVITWEKGGQMISAQQVQNVG